jgi:ABC-2 type transport system ATP-binding protein
LIILKAIFYVDVDDNKTAFTALNRWLLEHQVAFEAIEIVEPSLEDVFLALTDPGESRGENQIC